MITPEPVTLVKPSSTLLERADMRKLEALQSLHLEHRSDMGQFFTPPSIARFMASMLTQRHTINLLDAGAGTGTLIAASLEEIFRWNSPPERIDIVAYEIEPLLLSLLQQTLEDCKLACDARNIRFEHQILAEDFIQSGVDLLRGQDSLWYSVLPSFNVAILNPPYKKLNGKSETRKLLHSVGIETSNFYTAFLWLAARMLGTDGELISITPRSFCNGPYFFPFRKAFLHALQLRQLHVFATRDQVFRDDSVLQENIIVHAARANAQNVKVIISTSEHHEDEYLSVSEVPYSQVVQPDDSKYFIHVMPDAISQQLNQQIESLTTSLDDLGLSVSTGRVVDFRVRPLLRQQLDANCVPLIYSQHFSNGFIEWPSRHNNKKSIAIEANKESEKLLVPSGYYVLVKRFSPKEEEKRIVAAIYDPQKFVHEAIGFENHINYYHSDGTGLNPVLAKGLTAFLNSTLVDEYFRQFNGHTQVNAADLRKLKYPDKTTLYRLGSKIGNEFPAQEQLDLIVLQELNNMSVDPIHAKHRIKEALEILKSLGLPREQQNERSALTLLALLDMNPDTDWGSASNPLRGITEIMDFCWDHFGVKYAPNTRETFRRFTMHQFVQAGIAVMNPDQVRAPNSPKTCYQVAPLVINLIRSYTSDKWDENLAQYLQTAESASRLQPKEREMALIPIRLPGGEEIRLTSGGQNNLIKSVVEEFCPRFTPGGIVVYVGDAGQKIRGNEIDYLKRLGIEIDEHGKMPDVIVHFMNKNWLVIIEAVISHGPINIKRHNELKELFKGSQLGLVFVTAFESRKTMVKYLREIAWETDVWVAESPSHLIHFNGELFLGPYSD
ncbi:MAG: Eco57I restriction-modification methylase domain-containing protein [Anaerolineae bacterium]|nr:Eco57I restriction-modification methylase domain-containing protein [Anaerolineae bacterium]